MVEKYFGDTTRTCVIGRRGSSRVSLRPSSDANAIEYEKSISGRPNMAPALSVWGSCLARSSSVSRNMDRDAELGYFGGGNETLNV